MTIRILIADDHPLIRSGVHDALDIHPDIEVIGEAIDGDQALQMTEKLHPDVLLLDIHVPGMKTLPILSRLKRTVPETRVIILTACDDASTVLGMLKAGVNGYFVKDEDPQVLVEAIQAVMRGKSWLSPTVAGIAERFGAMGCMQCTTHGRPRYSHRHPDRSSRCLGDRPRGTPGRYIRFHAHQPAGAFRTSGAVRGAER
ncbi:MAG: response regulator transcription factor [Anaerolineaceae bacterium]|nr:response regulator transcription factor [Anaerolineaceae bacterium]